MNEDRLLAIPAFRNFWLGRLAANQIFALVIGWEIYELTSSAWWLGVAGLVQFLPSLLSFLLAGDLADRIDRRLILIGVMIAMSAMAVMLWLAALANAVSVPLLLTVCALLGLVRPFQMSAQQSLPSVLVAPRLLARAVALSSAGSQAVFIVAPALAGLVLIAGAVHVYALCTLVCVAGWVFHVRIRYDYTPPAPRPRSISDLFGGAVFIWQRPGLLGSITLDLFVVMLASVSGLLPVFAKDVLEADSWGLGLLRSAPAVGAVAISFLIARWQT
jgi:MFS family permease